MRHMSEYSDMAVPETSPNPEGGEKKCEVCTNIMEIDLALGVTHAACRALDGDKKGQCLDWIENIDPRELESTEQLWIEAIDRVGISGINKAAELFNKSYRNAIIKKVQMLQERGEPVPDELFAAYKEVLRRQTI